MTEIKWRLAMTGKISKVFSRSMVRSVIKGPRWDHDKTDVVVHRDPPVWHVQVGDVSYQVGAEEPPVKAGDRCRVTIEVET